MNTLLRCCIAAAAAASLAACAHSGTMRHQAATVVPTSAYQQDGQYIRVVEAGARRRGVDVHWVNPPVKRLVAAAADSPD